MLSLKNGEGAIGLLVATANKKSYRTLILSICAEWEHIELKGMFYANDLELLAQ